MLTDRHKARLVIAATFLLGIVVGASGRYLFSKQPVSNQSGTNQRMIDELTQVLRLDSSQKTQVDQVLDETRAQYQNLHDQVKPQFNAIRDTCREHIRAQLSPPQKSLYDQWIKEEDAKRKAKEDAAKTGK